MNGKFNTLVKEFIFTDSACAVSKHQINVRNITVTRRTFFTTPDNQKVVF